MMTLNSVVGDNIRRFREQFGLSQDEIAKYLGITHASVSNYETGKRSIPTDIISKVATLFGINGYDLYEENIDSKKEVIAFAFRAEQLTEDDNQEIAKFRTIVGNYLNMKTAIENESAND